MFKSLLSFEGRAGRETFFTVGALILLAKLCIVFVLAGLTAGDPSLDIGRWRWTVWSVVVAVDLALLWPLLALNVRRAHDRDGSGRLQAAVVIIATISGVIPPPAWRALPVIVANAAPGVVWGVLGLVMLGQLCLPGTPGPNRFGPSPKGVGDGPPGEAS